MFCPFKWTSFHRAYVVTVCDQNFIAVYIKLTFVSPPYSCDNTSVDKHHETFDESAILADSENEDKVFTLFTRTVRNIRVHS